MRGANPARSFWAGAACLLAIGIMAILATATLSTASAQTGIVQGDIRPEETAPAGPNPTEEPSEPVPTQPGTGGIVVTPPPDEPTPTEPTGEGENPDENEGPPPPTPDNEGVAPAVVVVVLFTADGGSVSDRTTVCVGEICQPVGAAPSGAKIEFERIVQGWQEISVSGAGAYEDGFASVAVRPGQRHTVELTLTLSRRVEVTPPPVAQGPIRQPIEVVDGGQEAAASRNASARFTTNVPDSNVPDSNVPDSNVSASVDAAAPLIRALPATGLGDPDRDASMVTFTLGAALTLLVLAAAIRRRAA